MSLPAWHKPSVSPPFQQHRDSKITRHHVECEHAPQARSAYNSYRSHTGGMQEARERSLAERHSRQGPVTTPQLLLICRFLGPNAGFLAQWRQRLLEPASRSALDGEGIRQFSKGCFRNSKTVGQGGLHTAVTGHQGQSPTRSCLNASLFPAVVPFCYGHPGGCSRTSHSFQEGNGSPCHLKSSMTQIP